MDITLKLNLEKYNNFIINLNNETIHISSRDSSHKNNCETVDIIEYIPDIKEKEELNKNYSISEIKECINLEKDIFISQTENRQYSYLGSNLEDYQEKNYKYDYQFNHPSNIELYMSDDKDSEISTEWLKKYIIDNSFFKGRIYVHCSDFFKIKFNSIKKFVHFSELESNKITEPTLLILQEKEYTDIFSTPNSIYKYQNIDNLSILTIKTSLRNKNLFSNKETPTNKDYQIVFRNNNLGQLEDFGSRLPEFTNCPKIFISVLKYCYKLKQPLIISNYDKTLRFRVGFDKKLTIKNNILEIQDIIKKETI